MVIILRIGKSAVLSSSLHYDKKKDEHSTTERVWVSNDSLINLKRLKIQSTPTFKVLKYLEREGIMARHLSYRKSTNYFF